MSVTIRLAKFGKRNQPSYRIVVANTRDKRNGRFLDTLGHYNPSATPESFDYDKKKYQEWIKKGALVSNAVEKLVEGKYEFKPYNPKQEAPKEDRPKYEGPSENESRGEETKSKETPETEDKGDEKSSEEQKSSEN